MKNYYEILEVNENASQEVIDKAYRVLAKKYHPDIQPSNKVYWAEDRFKEISEAYNVLSNPELRKEYDIKIGVDKSYKDKYNDLYSENQKLKQEVNNMRFRDFFKSNQTDNNGNNQSIFKKYSNNLKSLIQAEIKKPKEERSKDLIALIITLIIVAIIIFICWKVPVLHDFIFP